MLLVGILLNQMLKRFNKSFSSYHSVDSFNSYNSFNNFNSISSYTSLKWYAVGLYTQLYVS